MFKMGASHTLEAIHVEFFSDEDEPEVDLGNILNSYTVATTPNTRIHKDHPIKNVIGDVKSSVQTRRMTKPTSEQGFLSAVYKEKSHDTLKTCLYACLLSQIEPTSIAKALSDSSWVEAMQEELLNKKDKRGIVIRNEARIEAIRLFLAYAYFMGFLVYQMDVKSAFLYGTIEEEVYVTQPPGFKDLINPDKVYKVVKALYGLHQAPRAWYETLANYLLGNGFIRGKIDQTLFIKKQKGDILLVQVYVDDIIFGSTNKEMCTGFQKLMKDKFQMSSMGELTFFLGLQVQQKEDGIFISQDKYVDEILKKFNYTDVKSASTPVDLEKPLVKDGDANDVDVHLYRSMIGSLMYLTTSRPDIMFAVCACARFQVTLKTSHLLAVKRIFRYLKGKPTLGLWYSRDSPFELVAYTDSDYAGATQDRKSTTGGCQFLGNRLISWQCKKQTVVATSTTEAECVAAASCCGQASQKEVGTLRYLSLVVPLKKVGDEAVHKELGDRMERAATTASSLEAEQESVTAAKLLTTVRHHLVLPVQVNAAEGIPTDSEQTPITTQPLSSRPQKKQSRRKQRKETEVPQDETQYNDSVPIPSNDLLLSGEDRMQLTELIILCTNLQKQVLDLEKARDAQAKEIASIKKRVQELKRKKKSRTTGLKRLRKVGESGRVKSSEDKDGLGAQKDGRSDNAKMFDTNDLHGDEVIVDMAVGEKQEQSVKVDEREVSTGVEDIALDEEIARNLEAQLQDELIEEERLARKKEEEANIALIESWENTQAMMEANRLMAERLQTREQEELTDEEKAKLFMEFMEKRRKHFGTLRAQEKRNRPPTMTQKRNQIGKKDESSSKKAEIAQDSSAKRSWDKLEYDMSKKQKTDENKEVEVDNEAELKIHMVTVKDDDIPIDAIPLATKPPVIVEYKLIREGIMGHYQLRRADGSFKRYSSMIRMLQGIDKEDLQTLWKLVKTKHGDTRPEDEHERVLWGDLKVMFEPDIKSDVWINLQGYKVTIWKLFDSCGVYFVRFGNVHIFMLVEKRYPLTPITITNMLNKKLQADYWNEINLKLHMMNIKFRGGLLGLKDFKMILRVTTAQIPHILSYTYKVSTTSYFGFIQGNLTLDKLRNLLRIRINNDEKKVTEEPGKESGDPSKEDERDNQEKDASVNSTNNFNAASTNEVNRKASIKLRDDPNMPALEDIVYSDNDEDVGAEADMNNLDAFMPVSPIPTTRIHKDHPVEQIIRDLNSTPQTRIMTKNLEEHDLFKNLCFVKPPGFEDLDFPDRVYKVENALYGLHQAPRSLKDKVVILLVQVYVDDIIFGSTKKSLCTEFEKMMHKNQDKYVTKILKKFGFTDFKTAGTPMETQKPLLKDEDGEEVDFHLYRSMTGSLMYLTSLRPDIMFAVCAYAR
ncbi:putative ribonuclease H-like domain-containing protein [Tanacetum coccineum]